MAEGWRRSPATVKSPALRRAGRAKDSVGGVASRRPEVATAHAGPTGHRPDALSLAECGPRRLMLVSAEEEVTEAECRNASDEDLAVIDGLTRQAAVVQGDAAIGCDPSDFAAGDAVELEAIDPLLEIDDAIVAVGTVEQEDVGTQAPAKLVIARPADDYIVAAAAIDIVVAGVTNEKIVDGGADEGGQGDSP